MKSHRHFQTSAERRAVNGGDGRLRTVFDGFDDIQKVDAIFALTRSDFAELFDVGSGDKRLAGADHDSALDRIIGGDFGNLQQNISTNKTNETVAYALNLELVTLRASFEHDPNKPTDYLAR